MNKQQPEQTKSNPFLEASLDTWVGKFWNGLNKDNVQEAILTGASNTGFIPYDLDRFFPVKSMNLLLDFGCGIGRNIDVLRNRFGPDIKVIGYDLPNMLELMPFETKIKYDRLTSDFSLVECLKPSIIFASIVFQHIPTDILTSYLKVIAKWPHFLYVITRWYNDHDRHEVASIIMNTHNFLWVSDELINRDLSFPPTDPELHWSGIAVPSINDRISNNGA